MSAFLIEGLDYFVPDPEPNARAGPCGAVDEIWDAVCTLRIHEDTRHHDASVDGIRLSWSAPPQP